MLNNSGVFILYVFMMNSILDWPLHTHTSPNKTLSITILLEADEFILYGPPAAWRKNNRPFALGICYRRIFFLPDQE